MKIADVLHPAAIADELEAENKSDAIAELTDALMRVEKGLDRDEVIQALQERERLGSTGIGQGVAIPHGKLKHISHMLMSFGRSRRGIDFDSMDRQPAHLFFLLLAPENAAGEHLKTLARICKLMKNAEVRQRLLDATGSEAIFSIICEEENMLP